MQFHLQIHLILARTFQPGLLLPRFGLNLLTIYRFISNNELHNTARYTLQTLFLWILLFFTGAELQRKKVIHLPHGQLAQHNLYA
ncbi:unnamed protein product [Natator depressus]